MSSESNFVEIKDMSGFEHFIQKSHIVDFHLDKGTNLGYIRTILGTEDNFVLEKGEYENFCKQMKVQKKTNHLLTS
jgi:hypothetical protein